jgi:hypothetical protein
MRVGNISTSMAAMGPYTMVTRITRYVRMTTTSGLFILAGSALLG